MWQLRGGDCARFSQARWHRLPLRSPPVLRIATRRGTRTLAPQPVSFSPQNSGGHFDGCRPLNQSPAAYPSHRMRLDWIVGNPRIPSATSHPGPGNPRRNPASDLAQH